jgi:hypothetical protein
MIVVSKPDDRAEPASESDLPFHAGDLIGRMSRTDKAALIFHSDVSVGYVDGSDHWGRTGAGTLLREHDIAHFWVKARLGTAAKSPSGTTACWRGPRRQPEKFSRGHWAALRFRCPGAL